MIMTEFTLARFTEMNLTRRRVSSLITEKLAREQVYTKISGMFINLGIFVFTLDGYQIWVAEI